MDIRYCAGFSGCACCFYTISSPRAYLSLVHQTRAKYLHNFTEQQIQLMWVWVMISQATLLLDDSNCFLSVHNFRELPKYNLKSDPICWEQEKTEERGRPLQTGRQQTLTGQLVDEAYLGCCKMARSLHRFTRIFKRLYKRLYTHGSSHVQETLTSFSHVLSPDNFKTIFLSQGCIIGSAAGNAKGKQNTLSKDRRVWGAGRLQLPRASSQMNWWSCLIDDFLYHF